MTTRHFRLRLRLLSRTPLLAAPLLALGACMSAADMKPTMSAEAAGYADAGLLEVWGDEQRLQFSKQSNLELPAKVAVADTGTSYTYGAHLRDRRQIALVRALEEDSETFTDVVSLSGGGERYALTKDALEQLRAEASQFQADLLIVARRRETITYDSNALRVFNLLLLPMLFLPTESDDIEMSVRLAAIDVRNGLIYTTVDDLRTAHVSASVSGEDAAIDEAVDALYAEMIADMRGRLATKLAAAVAAQ